jgi:adenylylsulfate kinase
MSSKNITWTNSKVTRQRRNQQNQHRSIAIWFTGLSGSGKSTLAHAVEEKLHQLGCRTIVLDGDNIRHGLSSNLSFSDNDRKENIRRIGEVSKLMVEAGLVVITAFISPFREDRGVVKKLLPRGDFIEIYCKASLKTCESRDIKGLYKRARSGEIKNYTGIDSPYEIPNNPALVVNTENETLEKSVSKVIDFLKDKVAIN